MEIIIDFLRDFSDWISFSNGFTKLFLIPIVTSIIANLVYDIFKKGEVLAAEEFIKNSLRNFIKEDRIPDPNFIETLIETTAENYKVDVADLPKATFFIDYLIKEILINPLCNDKDLQNRVCQLEWLKQRCKKPCYWKLRQSTMKWIKRLLWTIIFALIWYFIIIMPYEYLNYTTNFVNAILMVLIVLIIICFLIYVQKMKELKYEEVVTAWERYKDKGIENAKNNKYESAVKYLYQAIETYPAKRTEEYDCRDSFSFMKRNSQKINEDRFDEALDLGELYILFGENLMNLGEERFDEAIFYFYKGSNILNKGIHNDIKSNYRRDKRGIQVKNINDSVSAALNHNFAKRENQIVLEKVVKRIKEIIKRIEEIIKGG